MKKLFCLVILLNICLVGTRAQILPTTNLYDTNLMMAHLNAVRQMSERAHRYGLQYSHIAKECINFIGRANIVKLWKCVMKSAETMFTMYMTIRL